MKHSFLVAAVVLAASSASSPSTARERSDDYSEARRYVDVATAPQSHAQAISTPARVYHHEIMARRVYTRAEIEGIRVLERMR